MARSRHRAKPSLRKRIGQRGFLAFDCTKAQRTGIRASGLARTIDDTAAWLVARDNANAWKRVIDGVTERAILDEIAGGKSR